MANNPLSLDENGEWAGMWWLPDAPNQQVPGMLHYDSESGLSLSLIGAFENRIMSNPSPGVTIFHEGSKTWNVIYGAAEQREITLLGCYPTNSKRTIGARVKTPDKQTIKITTALIGVHVDSEDKKLFSAVEISVEDIGRWGASSVIEMFLGATNGHLDGSGTLQVKPIPKQSVDVNGTEFILSHRYTLPSLDQQRSSTVGHIDDTTFMRIDPAEVCSVWDAQNYTRLIQDLVALATHRAVGVIWLRLKLSEKTNPALRTQRSQEHNVDVLHSPLRVGVHDMKAVQSNHMLFTCKDIPLKEIIPQWCKVYERLRPALNMILGLRYAPAQYVENNLLTAVGAAEVLHRNLKIDEPPIPSKEFKPMREAILEHVPEEYKEHIKGLLRNAPTLRERLCALAARPDKEAISSLIPNVDSWAQRTTQARNDLTHEGRTSNHSLKELIAIVNVTTAVVILNLLNEIGLSAELQRKIVQQHPQLHETAQQANTLLNSPKK